MSIDTLPSHFDSIISLAETAIVERLKPLTEFGFKVRSSADDLQELGNPLPFGLVFVNYEGSEISDPRMMGMVSQSEIQMFKTSIMANQRDRRGCYQVIQAIKMLLTGFIPSVHHERMRLQNGKSIKFESANPGTNFWEFSLTWEAKTYLAEDSDKQILEQVDALLKQIVLSKHELTESSDLSSEIQVISKDLIKEPYI